MLKIKYISIIGECVAILETEIQLALESRFPPIVRLKYTFCDLPFQLVSY